jgi:hypothetical protein
VVIMSSATDRQHSCVGSIPGSPIVLNALELPPGGRDVHGVGFAAVPAMESLISKGNKAAPNALYSLTLEDLRIGHMGDVGNRLTEPQLALLRGVDVLFAPVGGPPTIELTDLKEAIAEIKPRVTIPMHFRTAKLHVPPGHTILDLDAFLSIYPGGMVERSGQVELELTRATLPPEPKIIVLEHAG